MSVPTGAPQAPRGPPPMSAPGGGFSTGPPASAPIAMQTSSLRRRGCSTSPPPLSRQSSVAHRRRVSTAAALLSPHKRREALATGSLPPTYSRGDRAQLLQKSASSSTNQINTLDALRGSARQWSLLALHWRRLSRPETALRYLHLALDEADDYFNAYAKQYFGGSGTAQPSLNISTSAGAALEQEHLEGEEFPMPPNKGEEFPMPPPLVQQQFGGVKDPPSSEPMVPEGAAVEPRTESAPGGATASTSSTSRSTARRGAVCMPSSPFSFYSEHQQKADARERPMTTPAGHTTSASSSTAAKNQSGAEMLYEYQQKNAGQSQGRHQHPPNPLVENPLPPFRGLPQEIPSRMLIHYENQATPAPFFPPNPNSRPMLPTSGGHSAPIRPNRNIKNKTSTNYSRAATPAAASGGPGISPNDSIIVGTTTSVYAGPGSSIQGATLVTTPVRMSVREILSTVSSTGPGAATGGTSPTRQMMSPATLFPAEGGLQMNLNLSAEAAGSGGGSDPVVGGNEVLPPVASPVDDESSPAKNKDAQESPAKVEESNKQDQPPAGSLPPPAGDTSIVVEPPIPPHQLSIAQSERLTLPFAAGKHIEGVLRMNAAAVLSDLEAHEESKEELMKGLACADDILEFCQTQIPGDRLNALYNSGVSLKIFVLEALSEEAPLCLGIAGTIDLRQFYREQALHVAKTLLPEDHNLIAYTTELVNSRVGKSISEGPWRRPSPRSASHPGAFDMPPESRFGRKIGKHEVQVATGELMFDDLRSKIPASRPEVMRGYDLTGLEMAMIAQVDCVPEGPWSEMRKADPELKKALQGITSQTELRRQLAGVAPLQPITATSLTVAAQPESGLTAEKCNVQKSLERHPLRKRSDRYTTEEFYTMNPFQDFADLNESLRPRYQSPNYMREQREALEYGARMFREKKAHYDQDELFHHRLECTQWGNRVKQRSLVNMQRLRVKAQGRTRTLSEMDKKGGLLPKQIGQDVRMTTTEIRNSHRRMAQLFPKVKGYVFQGDKIREDDKQRLIDLMMSQKIKNNASDAAYTLRMKHMKEPLKSIWKDFIELRKRETGLHIKFDTVQERRPRTMSARRQAQEKAKQEGNKESSTSNRETPEPSSWLDYRFRDYRPKGEWAKEFAVQAQLDEQRRLARLGGAAA
ncbi:unnamed protein product [Amoebophrya sp. A25]|nr:unnamed protein product [Amoebophrya sp. A25]|eukprot:GSA25T00008773001.1